MAAGAVDRTPPSRTAILQVVGITVAWRLVMAACGVAAPSLLRTGANYHSLLHHPWPVNPATLVVDASIRLDAYWYARVAEHGYQYDPNQISSIGYFPLYPILIKLVSLPIGNVYVAGWLLSTVCLVLAAVVFAHWLGWVGLAHRAPAATVLLLVFPFSFFYMAMMTESLFLLLTLLAFTAAEGERWLPAAGATALAMLTRPTAVAALPALAVLASRGRSRGPVRWLPILAGVLALAAFAAYQDIAFGTPLAYVRTHEHDWGHVVVKPGGAGISLTPGQPGWYLAFMASIGLVFLAATPLVYRRLGLAYALYTALCVLVPATTTLPGMERYVIVAFPVFAALIAGSYLRVVWVAATFSFWLELLLAGMFVRGFGFF